MKIRIIVFTFLLIIVDIAGAKAQTAGKAVVAPEKIVKNMSTLMDYYQAHLRLAGDFTAYGTHNEALNRGQFLKELTTGDYLPLQLESKDHNWTYQLYQLPANADADVRSMLKQIGNTFYGFYQMIGKSFPKFSYVDLNGKTYTTENTKWKIVVLKAWFTGCEPCVAEMPELNKLTEQYKNRKDIVFVSIAWDSQKKLENFVKHTTFKYAVVPVKAIYIAQTLHATGYPAHWIINKQGIVVNMTYDHDEMIAALRKEAAK